MENKGYFRMKDGEEFAAEMKSLAMYRDMDLTGYLHMTGSISRMR
jgi:hypothetical protein